MDLHSKTNISDRIAENILESIRTKKLSVGDMLPSERDLIKKYGVSRLSCREALAKLQGMGILRAHHGKGVFLADIQNLSVNPEILQILQVYGDISNYNVLEARLILEPTAASLAAKRAGTTEREEILKLAQDAEANLANLAVLEKARRFTEADIAFHQFVATASNNPVLPMLLKSMHELLWRIRFEVLIIHPDIAYRALADHRKIANAIASGDAVAAEKAMERHIRLRGKELLQDETESDKRS